MFHLMISMSKSLNLMRRFEIFTLINDSLGFIENGITMIWYFRESWYSEIHRIMHTPGPYLTLFLERGKIRIIWNRPILDKYIRGHPHMASDDFGSFFTNLPTQIRLHQMEHDLPTYPNICRRILKVMHNSTWPKSIHSTPSPLYVSLFPPLLMGNKKTPNTSIYLVV